MCPAEQVLHRGVFLHRGNGHHPLVVGPAAKVVQLFGVRLFDGGARLLGFFHQGLQRAAALSPLDVQAVDGPSGPQGFGNGVAPGNEIRAAGPLLTGGAALFPVFLHNGAPHFLMAYSVCAAPKRPGAARGAAGFPATGMVLPIIPQLPGNLK